MKTEIKVDLMWSIAAVFFLFWLSSGWYRVDCALGVQRACVLIDAEYVAKAKP